MDDLIATRQKQHRFLCLQRWKEKTALSSDATLAWVKNRADLELRMQSPRKCPLHRFTRLTVYNNRARSGPASGKHPRSFLTVLGLHSFSRTFLVTSLATSTLSRALTNFARLPSRCEDEHLVQMAGQGTFF